MTSALDSESRAKVGEHARVASLTQQLESIKNKKRAVAEKRKTQLEFLEDGDRQIVALRAEQIVNGGPKTERQDTLTMKLIEAREQVRQLELDEQALIMAEETVSASLDDAIAEAHKQAAKQLMARYDLEYGNMKEILAQARIVNDRLVALDAELRKGGLAAFGGKPLILIARAGLSWNALAPLPIVGGAIHVTDWLKHAEGILGE